MPAERWGCSRSLKRRGRRSGPGPVAVEPQPGASAVVDELGGGVQHRWRSRLSLAVASSPVRQISLVQMRRSWGDQRGLEPGLVVLEGVVGEVAHAVSLPQRMLSSTRARPRGDAAPRRRCRCRLGRCGKRSPLCLRGRAGDPMSRRLRSTVWRALATFDDFSLANRRDDLREGSALCLTS